MQLPNLQFIKSIPVYGPRLYEAFDAVQKQTTRIETQGNLNATGDPPVPPPPDALNVTNGPSGEFQIAITHNGQFNRGTTFHTQWDTSPHFTNPHNIDHGVSRNDSSLNLPGQTVYFRSSAASPSGANSAWTYHGSQNRPTPVVGGVRGVRAPGMGSGTAAPGDQSGGPGPIQSRNPESGYDWKAQQRTAGAGFGASAQGSPAGVGASDASGGGGGGGGSTLTESRVAAAETLTTIAGTGDAITGVTVPSYSALAADFAIRYVPIHDNTTATTINVNGIGAKAITKNGTVALSGGELVTGRAYLLIYDGTRFQLVGQISPISATVLASDTHGVSSVAALPKGNVWVGNGSNLPVTLGPGADGKVLTANSAATNGLDYEAPIALTTTGTSGAATLTPGNPYALNIPNYSASSGSVSAWTPDLTFGGANVLLTYSGQSGHYFQIGTLIVATFDITLSAKGISTGNAEINGLPSTPSASEVTGGAVQYCTAMLLLTSVPSILAEIGTSKAALFNCGATGSANLTDANFTNTTRMIGTVIYSA